MTDVAGETVQPTQPKAQLVFDEVGEKGQRTFIVNLKDFIQDK